MKKIDFTKETALVQIMNKVKKVGDHTIACVMFRPMPWKLVPEGTQFNLASERSYNGQIAEFRTREELWQFIKAL